MKTTPQGRRVLGRLLFLLYAVVMLWLLFGQRIGEEGISIHFGFNSDNLNLIPFKTVKLYFYILKTSASQRLLQHAVVNLVGNVVLFVPLGWLLPCNWGKFQRFFPFFFAVLFLILAVEIIQYFTALGSCDVDDLILNIGAAVVGFLIWKIATYRQRKK